MKCVSILLIFALAMSSIVSLTHENFDEVVNGDKAVFVKFFAPWCGHCQALAPEYEIYADSFAKTDSIVIAEVDADGDKDLAQRFGIQGYPTLKFFPAGAADAPVDYDGGRTAADLVAWTNEKLGTNVAVKGPVSNVFVLTPSNFDETINGEGKIVFVKFYAPWCGHCKHLAPTYSKLADVFAEETNVIIAELDADKYRDLSQKYGISGFPTLKLFKSGEVKNYEGGRELSDMVAYVNDAAGTARKEDGSVDTSYGRIPEVDEAIANMKSFSDEEVTKVKEVINHASEEFANYKKVYESLLNKIKKNGEDYVNSEKERMNKFLQSDSVSKLKKGAFRIRKNVLEAFKPMKEEQEL